MWVDLTDIVKAKVREQGKRGDGQTARSVNALYGAMCNCQVAFRRCDREQTDVAFTNLVLAVDAFIYSLQNLNPLLDLFEPELAQRLENYALGEVRTALIHRPGDYIKGQLKLLRKLVHREMDIIGQPLEEFGSFNHALQALGTFIRETWTPEQIFTGREPEAGS